MFLRKKKKRDKQTKKDKKRRREDIGKLLEMKRLAISKGKMRVFTLFHVLLLHV